MSTVLQPRICHLGFFVTAVLFLGSFYFGLQNELNATRRSVTGMVLLLLLILLPTLAKAGGFADSCSRGYFEINIFKAYCNPYDSLTGVFLDGHIGNDHGNLVTPGAMFSDGCFNLYLDNGHTMHATCLDESSVEYHPSFELNDHISNVDGRLVWD